VTTVTDLWKLSCLRGDEWVQHSHAPCFARERTSDENARVVAGVPTGDIDVLRSLLDELDPPFYALYVLHTPRGEGPAGRYQSPLLDASELASLISDHASLLAGDARHDFWVHSPGARSTLVLDRHNLLHGYGPLENLERRLRGLGFDDGAPTIPAPHMHHWPELDTVAASLLRAVAWRRTALQPADEQ
jgi:hypothetical protein